MAALITKESPFRYPVQALVSTGEFYGNILYLTTSLVDEYYTGKSYYRPEPYFFWVYFIFMNAIWLVVPGCRYFSMELSWRLTRPDCLWESMRRTKSAFEGVKEAELRERGMTKKME